MINLYIRDPRCSSELRIHKKFTVIAGDSGIGKTVLIHMIDNMDSMAPYTEYSCHLHARVLSNQNWKHEILLCKDEIIFIESNCIWVASKEFYDLASKTPSYYILFTRDCFPYIPNGSISYYTFRIEGNHHILVPFMDLTVLLREIV